MGFSPFGGFGVMYSIVPIIIFLGFILVFGIIIYRMIQNGMEWNKNNQSPVLTVVATIIAKRTAVSSQNHMAKRFEIEVERVKYTGLSLEDYRN
jgi:hypothetical protein